MWTKNLATVAALWWLVAAAPAQAAVALTIQDGRVTLNATAATVREILAEWAQVGQTKIVNGDKVAGGPVTLQLVGVPEEVALEIILRSVSGYLAAPRPTSIANASRFDRIFIMPTSTPPRAVAPPAAAFSPPTFNPPLQQPPFIPPPQQPPFNPQAQPPFNPQAQQPQDGDDGDGADEGSRNAPGNRRGPIFNAFPQPQFVPPGQPGAAGRQIAPAGPVPFPMPANSAIGVAVPGMIVQPPQQPARPGQIAPAGQRPPE